MYIGPHVKCLLFCQILIKLEFSQVYEKNTKIPIYIKIRPVGFEIFHEDGQKDRQTCRS